MNKQNRQKKKTSLLLSTDSVTIGANGGFTENLSALHARIEGIRSGDGIRVIVSSYTLHFRVFSGTGDSPFAITPIVVQTAGTWTDNPNNVSRIIAEMLDTDIDDVFGFQKLRGQMVSKRMRTDAGGSGAVQGMEFTLNIPSNLLLLLNKETETERLQNLYLGCVGLGDVGDVVGFRVFDEIEYTEQRKNITIR